MKLTQLKAQLQNIFENISQLEQLKSANPAHTTTHEFQHNLITKTNALFSHVEKQTSRRLVQTIKKRQAKRRRCKKVKQKILIATTRSKKQTLKEVASCSASIERRVNNDAPTTTAPPKPTENEFHQLRNYQQAQRYLRTFELLEMLHLARSQDKQLTQQFHEKFVSLRAIWNSVLLENTPKRTEARRIEDQWDEVIFGASEHTFYSPGGKKTERERMREFLRIRRTWDSYLVRNKKHGSCIPLGWVLPKNEVSELWEQYKIA